MDASDFSEILEKSRALRAKQETLSSGFADYIPRLERALSQIDHESRRLTSDPTDAADYAIASDSRHDDSKALRLLSEYGFETGNIERNLQSVALMDAFEPSKSVADTDLDSYLGSMHESAIVNAIESALEKTKAASTAFIAATLDAEWEASKRELVSVSSDPYQSLTRNLSRAASTTPGGAFASPFRFPRNSLGGRQSLAVNEPLRSSLSTVSPTAPIYEATIRTAVHARANPNSRISIATELDNSLIAHLAPGGDIQKAPRSTQHLHFVYNALRYIAGEAHVASPPLEGAFGGMREKVYRTRAWLGAHRFLCLQFRVEKMEREIESRPVEAKRGGVPGMRADIRSFMNLVFDRGVPEQLARGTMHEGMPIWPQVYYSLRAGSLEIALEILRDAAQSCGMDSSVTLVKECLETVLSSLDRRTLSHELLEKLVQDYSLSVGRGQDPYKRVCYVVIARLDPAAGDKMALPDEDYSLLFYSIEDYLWLRLSLVRLEDDDKVPDSLAAYQLSLKSIQDEVKSFGAAHFDPRGDTPAFYAHVLILTGQYAEAITYLDRKARMCAEATHVAYVLYYYGILRDVNTSSREDSVDELDECLRYDYADLLWRYVSRFSKSDPALAAIYLFTLRNTESRNELLRKLLLETKEFGLLLGNNSAKVGDRGFGRVGVFEDLWPLGGNYGTENSWLTVVEAAAAAAEEIGDRNSAATLYDVAGNRGKVVLIIVDKLSAELTSKDAGARFEAFRSGHAYRKKLAEEGYGHGNGESEYMLKQLLPSFDMVLSLGEFYDLLWNKEFERAWKLIHGLGFLPVSDGQVMMKVSELRVGGGVWSDALTDRVPEILVGAMECLAALYNGMRQRNQGLAGSGLLTQGSVRSAGRTLLNFSGMIPNVSADISARLVRLDVLMG